MKILTEIALGAGLAVGIGALAAYQISDKPIEEFNPSEIIRECSYVQGLGTDCEISYKGRPIATIEGADTEEPVYKCNVGFEDICDKL